MNTTENQLREALARLADAVFAGGLTSQNTAAYLLARQTLSAPPGEPAPLDISMYSAETQAEIRAWRALGETSVAEPPAPSGLPAGEVRQAFEGWAAKEGYSTAYTRNAECGVEGGPVYQDSRTHAAWWAYRAGRATPSPQVAEPAGEPATQAAREYAPVSYEQVLNGLKIKVYGRVNPNDPAVHEAKGWNAALSNALAAFRAAPQAGAQPAAQEPVGKPDSIQVRALWEAYELTDEFKRAMVWASHDDQEGALFVAFRAGLFASGAGESASTPPAGTQEAEDSAPAGWVLVPVEPTDEMLVALHDAIEADWVVTSHKPLNTAYTAMLAAAPTKDSP